MRQGVLAVRIVAAVLLVVLLVAPSQALITRLTALQDLISDANLILLTRVELLDGERPAVVLAIDEALKGKPTWKKVPVLLKGDGRAIKFKESPQLLKRLAVKLPVVLLLSEREGNYGGFAFTNGTWFSLVGTADGQEVRWAFTHLEPYLRRTFKGTTPEMVQVIRDALAGKKKPPAPDEREKPGLGPEVTPGKEGAWRRADTEPLRGVIPTVLVGGPLAMLALLFPAVFGGWTRWLVLLSIGGTISTLYFLQDWFADALVGSWWGSQNALWTAMSILAIIGVCWAWGRHLRRVQFGEAPLIAGVVELSTLLVVSHLGLIGFVVCRFLGHSPFQPLLLPVTAFVLAMWVGTVYVLWTWLRGPRLVPALATEAVVLTALAVICVTLSPWVAMPSGSGGLEAAEVNSEQPTRIQLAWKFRLPERGAISSSPLVVGPHVYIAAAHDHAFFPYGAVYCLDRATGTVVWKFDNNRKMKQVFSTPTVQGERLYIGEGFHQDYDCKVYCLEVRTGKRLWEFQTSSHTESTPWLAGSRLYIGAGDDGLYCLDAGSGSAVWNFPGFHIDAPPVVVGDRVYVGCGIGDTHKETALFCLDAATGKQLWRMNTSLPVWSRPIVSGDFLFLGTGNGRLNEADPRPAGTLQCLRVQTGESVWLKQMPDGMLAPLAADRQRLYAGCRDGSLYCLRRHDGEQLWRFSLGSPVVAGTTLDVPPGSSALASRLYAVSLAGQLACLEPASGKLLWSRLLGAEAGTAVEAISTPALQIDHDRDGREVCRLYVGLTLQGAARIGELHCLEAQ